MQWDVLAPPEVTGIHWWPARRVQIAKLGKLAEGPRAYLGTAPRRVRTNPRPRARPQNGVAARLTLAIAVYGPGQLGRKRSLRAEVVFQCAFVTSGLDHGREWRKCARPAEAFAHGRDRVGLSEPCGPRPHWCRSFGAIASARRSTREHTLRPTRLLELQGCTRNCSVLA